MITSEEDMARLRTAAKAWGEASRKVMDIVTGPMPVMYVELTKAFQIERERKAEFLEVWEELKRLYRPQQ